MCYLFIFHYIHYNFFAVGIKQSKDSKLKGKELIRSDISGTKKIKLDGFHLLNEDRKAIPDLTTKVTPYLVNSPSAADFTGNQMGSLRDLQGSYSSLNGTMEGHLGVHTGEQVRQVGVIDVQTSDNSVVPVKKRKAIEWHDIQNNQETAMRSQHLGKKRVILSEDTSRSVEKNENKDIASNSAAEYSSSKMTGAINKLHDKTRVTSRTTKLFIDGIVDNQAAAVQPSAEGNSSSLKLSSSCRNNANFQESRGSPLDSVSSPLMAYSSERHPKISSVGNIDTKNLGVSAGEKSNRCLVGEVNGKMNQGTKRKERSYFIQQKLLGSSPVSKSRVLSPLNGTCNDHVKASFILDGVRGNVLPGEGGINVVNSMSTIPNHHNKCLIDKNTFQNQDKLNEATENDEDITGRDRMVISETSKRLCLRDRNTTSECEFNTDKMKLSNVFSEQEELHFLRNGMQHTPNQGSHLTSSKKPKGLEVCPIGDTVGDLQEMDKLAKASDNKNVARHGNLNSEENELVGQRPMRKCAASNAALMAMKEAKELKHAADRMKVNLIPAIY